MNQKFFRVVGGVLIFLGLLWVAVGAVFWSRMPRSYEATARFTLPDKPDAYSGPYLVQQEIEKVQSTLVLNQVITNLDLGRKWEARYGAKKELTEDSIFQLLKQRLNVRQTRRTTLLEAGVRSEDAREAAQIANEIANVYRKISLPAELKTKLAAGQPLTPAERERSTVELVDPAEPPSRPISPDPLVGFLNLVPGFCLGLGGLVMLAKSRKENQPQGLAT